MRDIFFFTYLFSSLWLPVFSVYNILFYLVNWSHKFCYSQSDRHAVHWLIIKMCNLIILAVYYWDILILQKYSSVFKNRRGFKALANYFWVAEVVSVFYLTLNCQKRTAGLIHGSPGSRLPSCSPPCSPGLQLGLPGGPPAWGFYDKWPTCELGGL